MFRCSCRKGPAGSGKLPAWDVRQVRAARLMCAETGLTTERSPGRRRVVAAYLVIFSLNASGQGAVMVDVLQSMEVCRQALAYRRAHGERNSHCVPTADLV